MNKSTNSTDPHSGQVVLYAGEELENASAAMIMVHGRGATAENMLSIRNQWTDKPGLIYAAPQAAGFSWYPYSFLYPVQMNEPGITSGLNLIKNLISNFNSKGINSDKIILMGFSQGACLILEYAARNARSYAAVIGLSGGLIGEHLNKQLYTGDFEKTPVFLGCSDIDPHIPLERINQSAEIIQKMNANVIKEIYPNMGHVINKNEINFIENSIKSI